ncbi:hypothetical protein CTI14_51435, partial [Methylobacterium radiotolerans]
KANDLLAQLQKNKGKFDDLAKKNSKDPGSAEKGRTGPPRHPGPRADGRLPGQAPGHGRPGHRRIREDQEGTGRQDGIQGPPHPR